MTARSQTILVLGGTGKTGRRVAARLHARGLPVRIGSRSGLPRFDWQDPAGWAPVLQDVAAVYLAYSPDVGFPGAAEAIEAFATSAADAGVQRLVLLSARGETGARRSEEAVARAGVEWTIVRASFFAQNFSEEFLADAVRGGALTLPAGEVAEPFIDAEDIADVAVAALTEHGHAGQVYELTGPRLLTFGEAAAEIAAASGRAVEYLPITAREFEAGMIADGLPTDFADQLTGLFTEVLDGRNAHLTDGVHRALGRPPRDFRDYARAAATTGIWDAAQRATSLRR